MDFKLNIPNFDEASAKACKSRWDSIAKPLGSLGLLEDATIKIAGLTGDVGYIIDKRAVVVMCADNGVVAQGVTQTGSEVTAAVAKNMTTGDASVCKMAKIAMADVFPVDVGILTDLKLPKLLNRRIAAGTRDISLSPAMSTEQAVEAINHGIELVGDLKSQGYKIILTGEMGIGNTTTSSAMASVMLGLEPSVVTGRGAGLSTGGLNRKIEIIEKAIETNRPDPDDAFDVLAKLGGFDIAGLAGVFLGGAVHRVPIIVDGIISAVAALAAVRMFPDARHAMLASHVSAEPAGMMLLDALHLRPAVTAGMYLGEGTGAVALLPLLDMAYAVYNGMPTFDEAAIDEYVPLS